jgi:hypothetical protein
MDDCGMKTNKKQESTGTDIDGRGGGGRGLGRKVEGGRGVVGRLASTMKNEELKKN